jgi:hypothetical protein
MGMNKILKVFNVTSNKELDSLIESLNLGANEMVELFEHLDNSTNIKTIRESILESSKTFGNGSYEKLQDQFKKSPFVRVLKEMPMTDDEYKSLNIGDRVKFDKPSQVPFPEEYDTIIDKTDKQVKTQFRHHGNSARTIIKWSPDHFKSVYSVVKKPETNKEELNEVGPTKYIQGPQPVDNEYVLCDVDGYIQWCWVIQETDTGNLRVEPIDDVEYDEIPTWSVKPADIIRYATELEEKELNNGETDYIIGDGKSKKRPKGMGIDKKALIVSEETVYDHSWYENEDGKYPKRTKEGIIIEDVNNNYISPKFKKMVDNWMSSGDEDDKEYVAYLDDLVYLYMKLNDRNEVKQWIEYFYQMPTDDTLLNVGKTISGYAQQNSTNMIQMDDHYLYNYLDENSIQELERIKQNYGINKKRKELEKYLKHNINESVNTELDLGKILDSMKNVISTTTSIELLDKLSNSLNEKIANAKSEEDVSKINEIKNAIKERVKEINNIGREDMVKECFEYSAPVSPIFNDIDVNGTLDSLFNNIKPATVNIEIKYEEKTDEEDLEMAKNNIVALATHINSPVDDCEENRIEELETIETLLSMLSSYFNKKLG